MSQIESVASLQMALAQADLGEFGAFLDQIEPHWQHLGKGQQVEIVLRHDTPRHLRIHVAQNAARILMKAITNALKHAFPDHEGGRVFVDVSTEDGVQMHLRVSDDGVGLQSTPGEGQGTGIIAALARNLDGEARWEPGETRGFALSVTFPIQADHAMVAGDNIHMTG